RHHSPYPSPLSLHDALPIFIARQAADVGVDPQTLFDLMRGRLGARIIGSERAEFHQPEEARVHGHIEGIAIGPGRRHPREALFTDRKSTRLNSSHVAISYAV